MFLLMYVVSPTQIDAHERVFVKLQATESLYGGINVLALKNDRFMKF